MTKIIPDKIFRNITDQRYLWIYDYARKLYDAGIEQIDQSNLNSEQIRMLINTIYYKNKSLFGTNSDEKRVFYLNLLVDSKEILSDIKFLYDTYLEEDNIEDFEMLEYYEKNGYKDKVSIIIGTCMHFYGLKSKEARAKINDAIHYYKINNQFEHYNQQLDKTKKVKKKHIENTDIVDLLAIMGNYNDSFNEFVLPDEIAAYEDDKPFKSR
jgi:hypothetical protein